MYDQALSAQLNDLLDCAVKMSDRIGRSDAAVFAYTAKDWQKSFRRQHRVRSFTPVPAEETFPQALSEWLGNTGYETAKAIQSLLGDPSGVYRAENEPALLAALSGSERGFGAFYTTEDAFFAVFETHVLAFLMGNFD